MRRTVFIFDSDPATKHLWPTWEARKASISGNALTLEWPHGTMTITAADPELVADLLFAHDSKAEIVTGRLGITSVSYSPIPKDDTSVSSNLAAALRAFLGDHP